MRLVTPGKAPQRICAVAAMLLLVHPAMAQVFEPVKTRTRFLSLVGGADLAALGLRLRILPDGRITGRAFGAEVTGKWHWQGGHFCRVMRWGARELSPDCQAVALLSHTLRFTAREGEGEHEDFWLRN